MTWCQVHRVTKHLYSKNSKTQTLVHGRHFHKENYDLADVFQKSKFSLDSEHEKIWLRDSDICFQPSSNDQSRVKSSKKSITSNAKNACKRLTDEKNEATVLFFSMKNISTNRIISNENLPVKVVISINTSKLSPNRNILHARLRWNYGVFVKLS